MDRHAVAPAEQDPGPFPDAETEQDVAELLSTGGAYELGDRGHSADWIARYPVTARQRLILARRHWHSEEATLWDAYCAVAEANERRALRPEPEAAPQVALLVVRRSAHRVAHRGPVVRRPGGRRTRRSAERAGPDDDPGPPARAVGGRP